MNNPQSSYRTLDTATIFNYANRSNIPWNMSSYRTPKLEVDARLQIQKRKWQSQKKGEKNGRYVTKRGFYMDYPLKVAKGIPSPQTHGSQKSWDFQRLKKSGSNIKIDPKLIKNTYLDKIEMNQKNRKCPGVGTYSLQRSSNKYGQGNKQSALIFGQRMFFYQNTQTLSSIVPGAGNYSPHRLSPSSRIDKSDYKFWVKKHKEENEKLLKRQTLKPAPGTHSPMNTSLTTFDQLAIQFLSPSKKKYLGLDSKFEYTRVNRKKTIEKRPDPAVHSTIIEWKGKSVSPRRQY